MVQSISQRFIAAVGPSRDRLYAEARLRAGLAQAKPARGAEGLLLQAIHVVFEKYALSEGDTRELAAGIATQLNALAPHAGGAPGAEGGVGGGGEGGIERGVEGGIERGVEGGVEVGENVEPEPMPADVWARLTAAVQMEAAKLPGGPILNPDSVLLNPDPLLTPKKTKPNDELMDGLNLAPASRFALGAALALVLGIAVTIYLTTRKTSRAVETAETTTAPAR